MARVPFLVIFIGIIAEYLGFALYYLSEIKQYFNNLLVLSAFPMHLIDKYSTLSSK